MTIDLTGRADIKEGVYSIVCPHEGRAYKLFKSGPEIPPKQTREGRRLVFESQCEAYRLASGFLYLSQHIPRFFGRVTVEEVIGVSGMSVKDDFLLDCCYATELLDGPELKASDPLVTEQYGYIAAERRRFANYRIVTGDASVFYFDNPDRFKIIDFEMEF